MGFDEVRMWLMIRLPFLEGGDSLLYLLSFLIPSTFFGAFLLCKVLFWHSVNSLDLPLSIEISLFYLFRFKPQEATASSFRLTWELFQSLFLLAVLLLLLNVVLDSLHFFVGAFLLCKVLFWHSATSLDLPL